LREALAPDIMSGRQSGRASGSPIWTAGRSTLFSKLDADEKDRFRRWADMPTARRIGDARVQAWIDVGKP
jgi:hypothetical protein